MGSATKSTKLTKRQLAAAEWKAERARIAARRERAEKVDLTPAMPTTKVIGTSTVPLKISNDRYKRFIEDNFQIVNKEGKLVDFKFNPIQTKFLFEDYHPHSKILKARQQGFSSLIEAIFTTDFIMVPYSYNVVVADIEENAEGLLDKVKMYIQSYEEKNHQKVPIKYNTRYQLYNEFMGSKFIIGTAKNAEFGRSKTITNLHLSEMFFYPNIKKLIAGAGQAVTLGGRIMAESTANGFNDGKKFYDDNNGFNRLFYKASAFYSKEFLATKREQLKDLFPQEYPESAIEAFLTSGANFFDQKALKAFLDNAIRPPLGVHQFSDGVGLC
jgi:hypothetical protein